MNNKAPYRLWDCIYRGTKKYEIRLVQPNSKWLRLAINGPKNTYLRVTNPDTSNVFIGSIPNLYIYDTFAEALERVGYQHCIPGAESLEEALEVYEEYFPDGEKGQKVLVIELGG